jgi:hypothetical protein
MEPIPFSQVAGGFHIEGFPDAAKLLRLDGPKAKRLSDLCLHKSDLDFVADCLDAINKIPMENAVVRAALWRSAVVHFVKCFGDSRSRFQLDAAHIYKDRPPEAMLAFQFFRDLRNKHFVHDENSYAQSIATAVLNKGDKPFKIEKIVCISTIADVLGQENWANLKLLNETAHRWVVAEFDALAVLLTKELEAESYESLLLKGAVEYRVPSVEEMSKRR